jgi:hypothetical protein
LEKIGIKITENLSNKQLRRIYLDNKKNSSDNVGSGAEQVDAAQTNDDSVNSSGLVNIGDTETIRDNLQPPSNSSLTNINLDTDSTSVRMNLHGTTPSTSAHVHSAFLPSWNQNNNIECSLLSNTIALCQQALAGLSGKTDKFNLHTAMKACQQQTTSFPLHYQQVTDVGRIWKQCFPSLSSLVFNFKSVANNIRLSSCCFFWSRYGLP